MIISASRRTDIPAFYSQWFFNRLKEGFFMVRNPMNHSMISKIPFSRDLVDCIVFWTKNPEPMFPFLHLLKDYPFYFLFTLTPYGKDLECLLPDKEVIIATFKKLSQLIGKERVIWRYDPIILSSHMNETYHYSHFQSLARQLKGYTSRCIISFIDMYKKCQTHLKGFDIMAPDYDTMSRVAGTLKGLAYSYNIEVFSCAQPEDFSMVGVHHAQCIDGALVSQICGYPLDVSKDKNQRRHCGCIESIDIGSYNCCGHSCLYCYANSDPQTARKNLTENFIDSPLLTGRLNGSEKIALRKVHSLKRIQKNLFI